MQRFFIILIVFAVLIVAYIYFTDSESIKIPGISRGQPLITFNNKVPLRVDVVDTAEGRAQGLSGRERLGPTEGLLFVFPENDYHGFWMKDMLFPIDIIWIDNNFIIVDIERSVRPDTFPRVFEPKVPARFVIETSANFTDSFSIEVGGFVTFPKKIVPKDLQK